MHVMKLIWLERWLDVSAHVAYRCSVIEIPQLGISDLTVHVGTITLSKLDPTTFRMLVCACKGLRVAAQLAIDTRLLHPISMEIELHDITADISRLSLRIADGMVALRPGEMFALELKSHVLDTLVFIAVRHIAASKQADTHICITFTRVDNVENPDVVRVWFQPCTRKQYRCYYFNTFFDVLKTSALKAVT